MFSQGSRYERVATAVYTDRGGHERPYVLLRTFPPAAPTQQEYEFLEHDRLDLLAFRFFGDPEQFWRICDANRTLEPESLEVVARRLLIPVVVR
jgi:hypothetical protein